MTFFSAPPSASAPGVTIPAVDPSDISVMYRFCVELHDLVMKMKRKPVPPLLIKYQYIDDRDPTILDILAFVGAAVT